MVQVFADLHIHSKYSRATSKNMNIEEISRFAPIKGLDLVGTGDFTNPKWFKELKTELAEEGESGFYRRVKEVQPSLFFTVSGEVSTVFKKDEETRKIHHLILAPNLEVASQISDRLRKFGNLETDGRPTLHMSAASLVEEVIETSSRSIVIPAHIWTPWFSLFGYNNGFDKIEDCYEDKSSRIFALETGLSSDPSMNWRLSSLDRFSLVSNSDSHSGWPWRLGREANVFKLEKMCYNELFDTLVKRNSERFVLTIETYPQYGKYHWTGHRNCGVSFSPENASRFGNICPVCRGKLKKGVEQRVDDLADRPVGYKPLGATDFLRLLPLGEIIQSVIGATYPGTRKVWEIYNSLVYKFGNEYSVLMKASLEELRETVDTEVAQSIVNAREGNIEVEPGYDGIYGVIKIDSEKTVGQNEDSLVEPGKRMMNGKPRQKTLTDFT